MGEDLRDLPIFICGHPKSGTSLLRSLLDSHPQLVVYPEETGFFRRYLPAVQEMSLEEKLAKAEDCLIHIFTWKRVDPPPSQAGFPDRDYSSVPFEAVRRAMVELVARDGFRHDGDLLSAAVLAFGEVTGQLTGKTLHWVEKTPYNELFTGIIYGWWPQARYIHVLRDPRDNFSSYRRKHRDWTAEIFADSWGKSTRAGLENRDRYGEDRYQIIRYEDLVQKPGKTMKEISVFLGIEEDEILWVPTRNGIAWEGNSMFDDRFSQISGTPIERWKHTLPTEEAGVLTLLLRPWMRAFGYPIMEKLPAKTLLRAWRWRTRRFLSRVKRSMLRRRG
jgi:hypothetical protein